MVEYRTPLPAVFAAGLEAAVNRVLALDTESAARLARLSGRLLQLDLEGLAITLFLTFEDGAVQVRLEAEGEPDTRISGTPLALFAMSAPGDIGNWGLPGTRVTISGDANLARDMERVFSQLDLDWEGQLSEWLGDVLGYQLATGLRQGIAALREAAQSTAGMAGSYLREESGLLATPRELAEFGAEVDTLRDGVDRLASRIARLQGGDA